MKVNKEKERGEKNIEKEKDKDKDKDTIVLDDSNTDIKEEKRRRK